jgi:hypothetical protein
MYTQNKNNKQKIIDNKVFFVINKQKRRKPEEQKNKTNADINLAILIIYRYRLVLYRYAHSCLSRELEKQNKTNNEESHRLYVHMWIISIKTADCFYKLKMEEK